MQVPSTTVTEAFRSVDEVTKMGDCIDDAAKAALARRAKQRSHAAASNRPQPTGPQTTTLRTSSPGPHTTPLTDILTELSDDALAQAAEAVKQVMRSGARKLPPALLLELHGLYQQATMGDCDPRDERHSNPPCPV